MLVWFTNASTSLQCAFLYMLVNCKLIESVSKKSYGKVSLALLSNKVIIIYTIPLEAQNFDWFYCINFFIWNIIQASCSTKSKTLQIQSNNNALDIQFVNQILLHYYILPLYFEQKNISFVVFGCCGWSKLLLAF